MAFISIQRDPTNKVLLTKWLRAVNSQEYRESILSFYRFLKNEGVLYWVVDITRTASPDMHDQKWTTNLLGPGICETNLKKIAVILPDDLFLEVVSEKMAEEVLRLCGMQVEIAFFGDYGEAFDWLNVFINIDNMSKEKDMFER